MPMQSHNHSHQADYTIYTDRSTSRRTGKGSCCNKRIATGVVTRGSPLQSEVVTTIKTKGRIFNSSYAEEAAAMESALSCTSTNVNYLSISILFCTDSKSVCEALISSNLEPFQFTISLTPFRLPSPFNGFLAILPFELTT